MPSPRLVAAVCAAGLFALVAGPSAGQEKKEKPKAPPRVAIDDPAKAKDEPDFHVQGEYEGTKTGGDGTTKAGAQVIALGNGQFAVKLLPGGLPGAGSDGKAFKTAKAERTGSGVVVKLPEKDAKTGQTSATDLGTVADGTMQLKTPDAAATLKRVERTSPTLGAKPPAGAVVLFAGPGDEKNWAGGKLGKPSDGEFLACGATSRQAFGAFAAHVEFRLPYMPNSRGQGRGNSGVYLQNRYELQVLDSFGLPGENNECGGFYTLHKPLVNMCLPPLVWQTYDIDFTPAGFDAGGKKTTNARATVRHNGVLIQDNVDLKGSTGGGQPEKPTPGPFQLQNHGDPVVYRNFWVLEKK